MMHYRSWIQETTKSLLACNIETARLDTLLLLEHVTGIARPSLLAHDDTNLTNVELKRLESLVSRRKTHEPMAYILGKKEFYSRDFMINSHVLVPRPESEDMISLLLDMPSPKSVIDVGTGSGVLAITAKLELHGSIVFGTDINNHCIITAQNNAELMGADISLIKCDLIADLNAEIINQSVLLANLPYVPEDYPLNEAAKNEPPEAIFSPENGLQHYRRLFEQLNAKSAQPIAIICESMQSQHTALEELATKYGFTLRRTVGLQQLFD